MLETLYTGISFLDSLIGFFPSIFFVKQLVQNLIPPPSIHIYMCTSYTYTDIFMLSFSPSGFLHALEMPHLRAARSCKDSWERERELVPVFSTVGGKREPEREPFL